ncbi:MAG: site-2 protease family protein [Oscillospiraceae bacterium]|jgi:Zn-dependent protease|nr:site-2 protease family protein [Oscillospiraceae bacterium]
METFIEQFNWDGLLNLLGRVAGVFLCLTVHETCHGLAACALGDPTAKRMQRLSLNPLHHIDWLGLASMVICGFGWAKPVPVDMRYFKNPRLGMAFTALAGPVSNFLLALLLLFAASLLPALAPVNAVAAGLFSFCASTAVLSIGLGLFNLVPIPPLDGSKVLFSILPEKAYYTLMRYERYGMAVLLLLVWLDVGGSYLSNAIYEVFRWMAGLFF